MTGRGELSRPPWALRAGRLLAPFPLRGRGRLAHWMWKHHGGRPDQLVTVTMRSGHVVDLPSGSIQTWTVAYTGRYDEAEIAYLSSLIEPATAVLDVGACFGLYTLPLAEAARSSGAAVVAVEPVPTNVQLLRANTARNDLNDKVTVVAAALGATRGEVDMRIERGGAGNAAIRAPGSLAPPGPDTARVPVRRLDQLEEPVLVDRRCSLMKIDAEGYEMAILDGAEELVERDRPIVFGEFNPDWLDARGLPRDMPERWAGEHAYDAFTVSSERRRVWSDRRTVRLTRASKGDARGNLLLVPRERKLGRELS